MHARVAFTSSLLAVLLGAGLIAGAFVLPLYNDGGTLVAVNGTGVLVPVSIPFVLAAIAFAGLSAYCRTGNALGHAIAVAVLAVAATFTLLSAMTIGMFVLPLTALIAVAIAHAPRGNRNRPYCGPR